MNVFYIKRFNQTEGGQIMKVHIDTRLCQGNIICVEVAPEVFKINREGVGEVYTEDIPADLEPKVQEAIDKCPRKAIFIDD